MKPFIFLSEIVQMLRITLAAAIMLATTATHTAPAAQSEPALSPAETAAVSRQIATLHSSTDRSMANGWTNAKKVAETICRPAAVAALKKQVPGTDRVFLGTDDPKTLNLESNAKLTGTGSARNPKGWQDFILHLRDQPRNRQGHELRAHARPSRQIACRQRRCFSPYGYSLGYSFGSTGSESSLTATGRFG